MDFRVRRLAYPVERLEVCDVFVLLGHMLSIGFHLFLEIIGRPIVWEETEWARTQANYYFQEQTKANTAHLAKLDKEIADQVQSVLARVC